MGVEVGVEEGVGEDLHFPVVGVVVLLPLRMGEEEEHLHLLQNHHPHRLLHWTHLSFSSAHSLPQL